eukprot:4000528-Amphidinium_carterae.1
MSSTFLVCAYANVDSRPLLTKLVFTQCTREVCTTRAFPSQLHSHMAKVFSEMRGCRLVSSTKS